MRRIQGRLSIITVLLAILILSSLSVAQEPSHPLSQINEIDEDLNMEGKDIENVSKLRMFKEGDGGLLIQDYSISGEGDAQRFVLDYQNDVWSVENSGLELNGNNISGLGGLDGFFDSVCNSGEAVVGIYDNGTVQCESVSGSTESLSETLSASNSAGDNNINLSGNNLTGVDTLNSNGSELRIGGNVTVGDGPSIADVNRLTDLPLQPTVDSFEDGYMSEYSISGDGSYSFDSSTVKEGINSFRTDLSLGTYGNEEVIATSNNLDIAPKAGQTFEFYHYIDSASGSSTSSGLIFGYNGTKGYYTGTGLGGSSIKIGKSKEGYATTNNIITNSFPKDEWLRYVIDWKDSGNITARVYDNDGKKLGQTSMMDSEFKDGKVVINNFVEGLADGGTLSSNFDGVQIIDSGGIEIDSDVQLEDSRLSDVKSIDGGGDSVNVDDNLDVNGNNVTNADTVEANTADTDKVDLGNGMSMERRGDDLVISD